MDERKVIIEQALVLADEALAYLNDAWTQLKRATSWFIIGRIFADDAYDKFEQSMYFIKEFGKKLKSTKLGFYDFEEFADYYISYSFDSDMEKGDIKEARNSVEDLIDKINSVKEQLIIELNK